MSNSLASQAGTAVAWKALQLAGTKVIYLARILILARLLSPEHFGLLAIASIAVDVLLSLTNFGMMQALVQRTEVDDRYYNAAWTVGITRAIVISGAVFLASPWIAVLFSEPRATEIMQVLAIRPLIDAAASIKTAELIRNLRFKALTFISLSEAVVNTLLSISLAHTLGVWALVAGVLGGAVASTATSYMLAPYRPRLSLGQGTVRPLLQFGRWVFVGGIVAVAASSLLQIVISRQLGAAGLGLYFLASKLAYLPYEVASQMVEPVAFPLYARLKTDIGMVTRAFQTVLTGMWVILLPLYTLLIALAPSLVQDVLGPRWSGTVQVIQLLAVVNILGIFGDAMVPLLQGLGQPSKVVGVELVQSSLVILFAWSLTSAYGLEGAALAWLPAIVASQLIGVVFIRQHLEQPLAQLVRPLLAIVGISAVSGLVGFGVDSIFRGFAGFVIAAALSLTCNIVLLGLADRRLNLGIIANVPKAFPQIALLARLSSANGYRSMSMVQIRPAVHATAFFIRGILFPARRAEQFRRCFCVKRQVPDTFNRQEGEKGTL